MIMVPGKRGFVRNGWLVPASTRNETAVGGTKATAGVSASAGVATSPRRPVMSCVKTSIGARKPPSAFVTTALRPTPRFQRRVTVAFGGKFLPTANGTKPSRPTSGVMSSTGGGDAGRGGAGGWGGGGAAAGPRGGAGAGVFSGLWGKTGPAPCAVFV